MNYILENIGKIQKKQDIELISFDVFDTLMFRLVQDPVQVFEYVGEQAVKEKILPKEYKGEDYRELRIAAEKKARRASVSSDEVHYEDIYLALPNFIVEKDRLAQIEWEMEKQVLYANPIMLEVVQELAKMDIKMVVISDMYYSKEQIKELLENAGISSEYFEDIFVSADYEVTKNSGKLYEVVKEKTEISYEHWLHIGDNLNADVLAAERKGIHTIYFEEANIQNNKEMFYEKMIYGKFLPEISTMRRYLPLVNIGERDEETQFWYKEGVQIFGPLLTTVVEWVLDIAQREHIHRIFPLMREGKIFARLIRNAAKARNMDIKVEELYISRKAVFLPSITEITKEDIKTLMNAPRNTLHHTMLTLGIEHFEDEFRTRYGDGKEIGQYQMIENLYQFIKEEQVKKSFENYVDKRYQNAKGYFDQMGLNERFITIDIGAHGTIQRGLENTLRKAGIRNHNIHLLAFSVKTTAEKVLNDVDIRGFIGSFGFNNDMCEYVSRNPALLEEALMCEEGSTKGYLKQKNQYVPVLGEAPAFMQTQRKKIEILQKGVVDFQTEFLRMATDRPFVTHVMERKTELAHTYIRLFDTPTVTEVRYWGDLYHDDNFGRDITYHICSEKREEFNRKEKIWSSGELVRTDSKNEFFLLADKITSRIERGMVELIKEIYKQEESEIVIIGAGEAGRTLKIFCDILGIQVIAFVDNNRQMQGNIIEGIPIISMENSPQKACFVIGSIAFSEALLEQTKKAKMFGSTVILLRGHKAYTERIQNRENENW